MPTPDILIVEDEPGIRGLLGGLFDDWGYAVATVSSAEEAVPALDTEERPRLIILDIRLPGASGETVLRRVKELGLSIPVIVYSGALTDADKRRIRGLGARAIFTKPSPLQQLKTAIQEALADTQ